jgi:hypothetical protein
MGLSARLVFEFCSGFKLKEKIFLGLMQTPVGLQYSNNVGGFSSHEYRGGIFKPLWSPEIDSKESIPSAGR